MTRLGRLVRWSWRDLRARWLQVLAIALIIGLGSGLYAGLGSTATWRRESNDISFAQLGLHHLRAELAEDSFTTEGSLLAAVGRVAHPEWIAAAEERLIVPTQFDLTGERGEVLLPGQLNGMAVGGSVDTLWTEAGRPLAAGDVGGDVMVIDQSMATNHRLAVTGTAVLAGGKELAWVGTALQPEWFVVTDPRGGYIGGASYGVAFTSLPTAQRVADRPGQVNDLVVRVAPTASVAAVAAELEAALARVEPRVAATVTTRDDVNAYHLLYQDIEGDQKVWNAVSIIVLVGAAFAASNLVSRMIEAQRRELGIGMALGAPPPLLAVRPALVGLQIGVAGVVLGMGAGWLINQGFRSVLDSALPLPTWVTPFQYGAFATAALLGVSVALAATAWPVWRAMRMSPLEALQRIRPVSWRTLFAPRARGRRSRSLTVLPFRDLLRAPRRTVLTALGIAAAISVLVAVLAMMDSFLRVVDRTSAELGGAAGAVTVDLAGPVPQDAPLVLTLVDGSGVARASVSLVVPGELSGPAAAESVAAVVELVDTVAPGAWLPNVARGRLPAAGEVLIADKAASDLGVAVGSQVTLRHARLAADGSAELVSSSLVVSGIHRNPLRSLVYLDQGDRSLLGLAGQVNQLRLDPAAGTTPADLQRLAFDQEGVRAARSVRALLRTRSATASTSTSPCCASWKRSRSSWRCWWRSTPR